MTSTIAILALAIAGIFYETSANVVSPGNVTIGDIDKYLVQFGYASRSPASTRSIAEADRVRHDAVRSFQRYFKLPVTGELDDATKYMMAKPRCGMTDTSNAKKRGGPNSQHGIYSVWNKTQLTWGIRQNTKQLDQGTVRRVMTQAFATWAEHIPVTFTEVDQRDKPNFLIDFGAGKHVDCYWGFDGQGGVLAHALFPPTSFLHFDEDEQWAYNDIKKLDQYYIDILAVAVHELGHALGLEHSKEQADIMYPMYQPPPGDGRGGTKVTLGAGDIFRIQLGYDPKNKPPGPAPVPTPTTKPDTKLCRDDYPYCNDYSKQCGKESWMERGCQKTCGFCK